MIIVSNQQNDTNLTNPDSSLPDEHTSPIAQPVFLWRFTRHVIKPIWHIDFVSTVTKNDFIVPSSLILSSSHYSYLFNVFMIHELSTFPQASIDAHWIEVMQKELQALETNQIWIFINLPKGKKAIRCKWVYKVKCKPTGEVDRYKARLVAKEYNQIEGLDYKDMFSPVAKLTIVRIVIALAIARAWPVFSA